MWRAAVLVGLAYAVGLYVGPLIGQPHALAAEIIEGPLIIHKLAGDPTESGRFYAITGNMGVLVSVDGGRRWTHSNHGLRSFTHHALWVTGADQAEILVGGWGGGVSISVDRGRTWRERNGDLGNTAIDALLVDAGDPSWWYAAVSTGIYRTRDRGVHWEPFADGLPVLSEAVGLKSLALESSDGGRIWLGTEGGLFRRERGAARWVRDPRLGTSRVSSVAVGVDGRSVYIGTVKEGIYVGGRTGWRRVGDPRWFVSQIVPDPEDASRIYATTRGAGLFVSEDRGTTWKPLGHGLSDPDLRAIAVHPADRRVLVVGTTSSGVFFSGDRGVTWRPAEPVSRLSMSDMVAMLTTASEAAPTIPVPPAFSKCNGCHGWTVADLNAKHTYWRVPPNPRVWETTVERMAARARLTPQERSAIVRFLNRYSSTARSP